MSTAASAWRAMPEGPLNGVAAARRSQHGARLHRVGAHEQPREARRPAVRAGLEHHGAGGLGDGVGLADADAPGLVLELDEQRVGGAVDVVEVAPRRRTVARTAAIGQGSAGTGPAYTDASSAPAAGTVPRCVESPWPSPSSRCPCRPRRRRP